MQDRTNQIWIYNQDDDSRILFVIFESKFDKFRNDITTHHVLLICDTYQLHSQWREHKRTPYENMQYITRVI